MLLGQLLVILVKQFLINSTRNIHRCHVLHHQIFFFNSSSNILGDDVEDDNFEMNDDNEQGDQSSTNVDPTNILGQNLSIADNLF